MRTPLGLRIVPSSAWADPFRPSVDAPKILVSAAETAILPTTMRMSLIQTAATLACILTALSTTGCVTRRTVTVNGETKSEKYVVKRPIRDAIQAGKQP